MPFTSRRNLLLIAALLAAALMLPTDTRAATPDPGLFWFPGSSPSPASARSAGLALAERWLGELPFDNPAVAAGSSASATPLMLRVSRQDLRARSSSTDETAAFLGIAGGHIALAHPRGWGAAVYMSQPVLRQEEAVFATGTAGGLMAPSTTRMESDTRELRAGVALSWAWPGVTIGVAPEWTSRSDRYVADRQAGGGAGNETRYDLSGSGPGFIAGVRLASPGNTTGGWRVGAGARRVPELVMDGQASPTPGATPAATSITRESAWEGGLSIEARVSPVFSVVAGVGGRTGFAWSGTTVRNGAQTQTAIGGEFHDPQLPWRVSFGLGHESSPGAPEPVAGLFGLGFGWVTRNLRYDAGVLHRGIRRNGQPTLADDRVAASVTLMATGK